MTIQKAKELTSKEVFTLLKKKGHTNCSAQQIADAHGEGRDFSFLF
jgi:hypothetical protein